MISSSITFTEYVWYKPPWCFIECIERWMWKSSICFFIHKHLELLHIHPLGNTCVISIAVCSSVWIIFDTSIIGSLHIMNLNENHLAYISLTLSHQCRKKLTSGNVMTTGSYYRRKFAMSCFPSCFSPTENARSQMRPLLHLVKWSTRVWVVNVET